MPIKREPVFPMLETLICDQCGLEMKPLANTRSDWPEKKDEYITHFCANDHSTQAVTRYPQLMYYTQKELDDIQRNEQKQKRKPRGG